MSNIISFFQKLIKGGVGIRAGGLEYFSKMNKRGGRLFGTREYVSILKRHIAGTAQTSAVTCNYKSR